MVTTIQIEENTMEQLKRLKKWNKAKSYDAVIKKLIKDTVPNSMYGSLSHLKLKDLLKDLRDKNDRF